MQPTRKRPLFLVAFYLILLLLAVYSEYWLAVYQDHGLAIDFGIYCDAYTEAVAGGDPYQPYVIGESFLYHPFALTLVSPFCAAGPWLGYALWTLLSLAAWGTAILLLLRLLEAHVSHGEVSWWHGARLLVVPLLLFAPLWETLHMGQINTLLVVTLVLSLYLSERGHPLWAGLGLAVSIWLKLSPALLLLYFLLTRRYRVLAATAAGLVLLTLLPLVQFGPGVLRDYIGVLPRLGGEIFPTVYNQTFASTAHRVLTKLGYDGLAESLYVLHRVALLLGVGLTVLLAIRRPPVTMRHRLWLFALFNVWMVLSSPLLWYHHNVLLVVPLLLLAANRIRVLGVPGEWAALMVVLVLQVERLFEREVIGAPLPILAAHALLLLVMLCATTSASGPAAERVTAAETAPPWPRICKRMTEAP